MLNVNLTYRWLAISALLLINTVFAAGIEKNKNESSASLTHHYPLPPYSTQYDPQRDPFEDGRKAIAHGKATHRHIIIEAGGNWCPWCKKLNRFINNDAELYQAFHRHFVLLKVNVSDTNENEAFFSTFPTTLGYPHFYVADMNGTLLHSQDTAAFLEKGDYSKEKLMAFIQRWRATNIESTNTTSANPPINQ
jgi:thiol:disulfide interchange protein